MSKIKSITSAITAAVLVSGIGFAWAQSEEQQPSTNSTTAANALPSEQTPADPNAAPLSSTAMPQESAATTPPPVDSTTPAPQSSDANSQAPLSTTTSVDSSSTATTTTDRSSTSSSYEPAPRADRN